MLRPMVRFRARQEVQNNEFWGGPYRAVPWFYLLVALAFNLIDQSSDLRQG